METFTDPRDGNVYKIVKIGNLYWFAENLKYRGVPYHFPNRDSDNAPEYNYLYTLKAAKEACPPGWRLPTAEEYLKLIGGTDYIASYNTTAIQSTSWDSSTSNSTGFSALPAGLRLSNGSFYNFGSRAYFWSVTPYDSTLTYILCVYSNQANIGVSDSSYAFSIRYVKEGCNGNIY